MNTVHDFTHSLLLLSYQHLFQLYLDQKGLLRLVMWMSAKVWLFRLSDYDPQTTLSLLSFSKLISVHKSSIYSFFHNVPETPFYFYNFQIYFITFCFPLFFFFYFLMSFFIWKGSIFLNTTGRRGPFCTFLTWLLFSPHPQLRLLA